ncbi:MAG: adenylate/guanylate cyclase domain-containing protein [Hyphomicrobiaceae bacterium]
MARDRDRRRLAAIVAIDMVEYSRLVEADERGTISRQARLRNELMDPLVVAHNGRIVKSTGDGLLVEFASVVDATECAANIQRAMARRERKAARNNRIQFRIGINLGDIISHDDDIFGDGVNIAVRLEGLAEPGGIVVSGIVYEVIRTKLELGFRDLGMQKVKNMVEPIRALRVDFRSPSSAHRSAYRPPSVEPPIDRPSVAVLPFANPSRDPDQEYFADGITEDLITDLSKVGGLFVIGRNSSFALKGTQYDTSEVGRQLGVQHILEGSVRRSGNRVRINAQLVEVKSRGQLWADRFDGDLSDIFRLQDEISGRIVASLETRLTRRRLESGLRQQTSDPVAYDLFLKGRAEYYQYTQEHMAKAQRYFQQAIEKDPQYARALEFLSHCLTTAYVFAWGGSEINLAKAIALAERSITLDPQSATGYARLGWIQGYLRLFDRAVENFERAISLEPRSAEAYYVYGETMNKCGEPYLGLPLLERAYGIDSIVPPSWDFAKGHSWILMQRTKDASSVFENVIEHAPQFLPAWVQLVRTYSEENRLEDAQNVLHSTLQPAPQFNLDHAKKMFPYQVEAQARRFENALQTAGVEGE